jgi:hypothetical protein
MIITQEFNFICILRILGIISFLSRGELGDKTILKATKMESDTQRREKQMPLKAGDLTDTIMTPPHPRNRKPSAAAAALALVDGGCRGASSALLHPLQIPNSIALIYFFQARELRYLLSLV